MPSFASITLNDFDGQAGIVGFNIPNTDAANFAAEKAAVGSLAVAISTVTLGVLVKDEMSSITRYAASNVKASDPSAQRGNKWFVSALDNTQWLDAPTNTIPNPGYLKPVGLEIPTADLSLRVNGSDVVWQLGAAGNSIDFTTLAGEIEDIAVSAYGGELQVQRIEAVTRSGG